MRVKIVSNYFNKEMKQLVFDVIDVDKNEIITIEYKGIYYLFLKTEYIVMK